MELAVSSYRFRASFRRTRSMLHELELIMNDDDDSTLTIRRDAAIAACRQALREAQRRIEARQAELDELRKQADVRRDVARTGK